MLDNIIALSSYSQSLLLCYADPFKAVTVTKYQLSLTLSSQCFVVAPITEHYTTKMICGYLAGWPENCYLHESEDERSFDLVTELDSWFLNVITADLWNCEGNYKWRKSYGMPIQRVAQHNQLLMERKTLRLESTFHALFSIKK